MSELVFITSGQAAALAAQESLATKAKEVASEFEAGAKATKTWDANMAELQRKGEGALRSIQTEQEKIATKIADLKDAMEKGLIPPEEAEEGIKRLEQKWIDVDQATLDAKAKSKQYAEAQQEVKSAAEAALESVKTEIEDVEEQIEHLEAAARDGLVPTDEAEEGIRRLRDRLGELQNEANSFGEKLSLAFNKAFSFDKVIKLGVQFVGVGAAVNFAKRQIADLQKSVDDAAAFGASEEQSRFVLGRALAGSGIDQGRAGHVFNRAEQIADNAKISRSAANVALAQLIEGGADIYEALGAVDTFAGIYPDKPAEIVSQGRAWIDSEGPVAVPTRRGIESLIPGGAPRLERRQGQEVGIDAVLRRRADLNESLRLATSEDLERAEKARLALGVDYVQATTSTISARAPWSEGGTGLTRNEVAGMIETYMQIARQGGGFRTTQETDRELLGAVKELADEMRGLRGDVLMSGGIGW